MDSTEFEPGEPGRDVPVARQRAGTPKNRKHPLTGPQRMPEENIEKTLDTTNNTGKSWQRQVYPIRLLERRYELSQNFAVLLVAEFRWGGL
jgi:hypothetical protein